MFGHHSSKCTNDSVCGQCAGNHETRDCTDKGPNTVPTCNNCKSADASMDCAHKAGSLECPILKEKQEELKRHIPFFQRKKLENRQILEKK